MRSQLTQEKVQNWTTTTFPRRPAGVSGAELSQAVAPSRSGSAPSTGSSAVARHRSDLNVARISSEKVCGCSQAAKWPPSSTLL